MKKLICLCAAVFMLTCGFFAFAEETDGAELHTNPFNFETGTVILNNGIEMPINGIGTFTLINSQAEETTYWCLYYGGRLIDTAAAYGNEVGSAGASSGLSTRGS